MTSNDEKTAIKERYTRKRLDAMVASGERLADINHLYGIQAEYPEPWAADTTYILRTLYDQAVNDTLQLLREKGRA